MFRTRRFSSALQAYRHLIPDSLKMWQEVRIVQMNGCMAHIRHNPRDGQIIGFINRKPYGSSTVVEYAQVKMHDTGEIREYPSQFNLWSNLHDGKYEYQI